MHGETSVNPSRLVTRPRCWCLALLIAWLAAQTAVRAQPPRAEDRLDILTDPESVKQKLEKDKARPPLEFFRSQIAPFDILPFVKPNHWTTLSLEMRANHDTYAGMLQTEPVPLRDMPHEIVYRRDARLAKGQRTTLSMQMMLPQIPRELGIEAIRPEGVRADETWKASLRILDPHQMLVVLLTRGSSDGYANWGRFQAFTPTSADLTDQMLSERQRYYRLVLPLDPEHPLLSSHPLTWTTISHVIWDGMPPDSLKSGQQEAMLDWLHWGGQLILVGGATPAFTLLRDSFLNPYLPADPSGEGSLLGEAELRGLSAAYPPPALHGDPNDVLPIPTTEQEAREQSARRYRAPEPIRPASNRPLYVAGLTPREGSSVIPLDDSSGRLLGVERRVGRGRILMLTVNPTDSALATWPGLDTLVRRVLLRRPEEAMVRPYRDGSQGPHPPLFAHLSGQSLSWFRYLSRDFTTSPRERTAPGQGKPKAVSARVEPPPSPPPEWEGRTMRRFLRDSARNPVAEWNDASALPRLCRDELERASGITIPSASFVLKVIGAYLLALVPLNWLVCRYVFGRREWAWIVVPVLALGFAFGVERAAAYDMGYDTACDEIDVVEVFGGYPRAHLSRFVSLYSTGRVRFSVAFPDDSTALALPLDSGRSLRGEDVSSSVWQSFPTPTLASFPVQPRSLAMFRAEQLATLTGSISLVRDRGDVPPRIVNRSDLELRDAVLVDVNGPGPGDRSEIPLGTIAPGSTVEVVGRRPGRASARDRNDLDPDPFLHEVRSYFEDRPENRGEIRLVGWTPRAQGGLELSPAVDRHRGFSLVVVHLRNGPPPPPDGPSFNTHEAGTTHAGPAHSVVAAPTGPAPDPGPTSGAVATARQEAGGS
jgi:hypothetical protein